MFSLENILFVCHYLKFDKIKMDILKIKNFHEGKLLDTCISWYMVWSNSLFTIHKLRANL